MGYVYAKSRLVLSLNNYEIFPYPYGTKSESRTLPLAGKDWPQPTRPGGRAGLRLGHPLAGRYRAAAVQGTHKIFLLFFKSLHDFLRIIPMTVYLILTSTARLLTRWSSVLWIQSWFTRAAFPSGAMLNFNFLYIFASMLYCIVSVICYSRHGRWYPVLGIREILVRIRIRGSIPLTHGSGSGLHHFSKIKKK